MTTGESSTGWGARLRPDKKTWGLWDKSMALKPSIFREISAIYLAMKSFATFTEGRSLGAGVQAECETERQILTGQTKSDSRRAVEESNALRLETASSSVQVYRSLFRTTYDRLIRRISIKAAVTIQLHNIRPRVRSSRCAIAKQLGNRNEHRKCFIPANTTGAQCCPEPGRGRNNNCPILAKPVLVEQTSKYDGEVSNKIQNNILGKRSRTVKELEMEALRLQDLGGYPH